jgi:hypothetical protein
VAREYARLKVSIWADPDFRRLTPSAQHLYFALLTSPSLTHCGVGDWRPKRLAALAEDWTEKDVLEAANELSENLYLVVDEDTEEVLIRSFIRHDGLMHQPRMAVSMVKAQHAVASSKLRGVIVHELRRLKVEQPDLPGWKDVKGKPGQALDLLEMESIDPADLGVGLGSVSGSVSAPFGSNAEQGLGYVSGSPTPAPIPPAPEPSIRAVRDDDGDDVASKPARKTGRKRPPTPLPDDWKPNDRHLEIAKERGLDPRVELESFRDYAASVDWRKVDWDATFRNWLRNSNGNTRSSRTDSSSSIWKGLDL